MKEVIYPMVHASPTHRSWEADMAASRVRALSLTERSV